MHKSDDSSSIVLLIYILAPTNFSKIDLLIKIIPLDSFTLLDSAKPVFQKPSPSVINITSDTSLISTHKIFLNARINLHAYAFHNANFKTSQEGGENLFQACTIEETRPETVIKGR